VISVEEALAQVLALARPTDTETVDLRYASGRVLVRSAVAQLTQPPFDASAMDGYAIRESDHLAGARLAVVGEAAAGRGLARAIGSGEAARIFTGAPVPVGADRIVLQEDVTREGDRIVLGDRMEQQAHIRPAGQDFREGETVAAPRRLGPRDIALLAAMNLAQVEVRRRPVVAFLSTGDELVMPGETPGPSQIVASNALPLAALAEAEGAEARLLPIARDTETSLRHALSLAEDADLIVTIGGASVGDHDLVGKVTTDMGMTRSFWKVSMRPGKPLMAGRMGNTAVLGLPGNPVSSIVCGHVFMLPLIRALLGLPAPEPVAHKAELAVSVAANGPRAHYMRARLSTGSGLPRITPFDRQDSALLSVLAEADALLIRPVDDGPRAAGEVVEYLAL